MGIGRRTVLAGSLAGMSTLVGGEFARAQDFDAEIIQTDLVFGGPDRLASALAAIKTRGNPDFAAGLILAMRFSRAPASPFADALRAITGEDAGQNWFDWMMWQERSPEIRPHPAFAPFKRKLYLQIDPAFDIFLKPEYLDPDKMTIRLEEIAWGGVRKDGIPSLDNPELIPADEATYLLDDDLVFGVALNGDARAYPLRIMGWHEMFNDVIGGVPVALAYCTLCGSGILFETHVTGRNAPFVFGSSGFLYRSNKLMFDRETHSLWNQFTGKPVMGPLVDSGIALRQQPVVITTWANWVQENPETRVITLNTGHRRDYGSGVVYKDYFASPDLMFPTNVDQSVHRQKDYVFGIRTFGASKAWPLTVFGDGRVINDTIGDTRLVLVGNARTRTVRAYRSDAHTFSTDPGGLRDSDGDLWTVGEESLTAPDGKQLPRVAGHVAYWFAWNGYVGAQSELYSE